MSMHEGGVEHESLAVCVLPQPVVILGTEFDNILILSYCKVKPLKAFRVPASVPIRPQNIAAEIEVVK